jgi:hypothetical protein
VIKVNEILIQDTFEVPGIGEIGTFSVDEYGNSELVFNRNNERITGKNIHSLEFLDINSKERER